jgi:hypothetical protein
VTTAASDIVDAPTVPVSPQKAAWETQQLSANLTLLRGDDAMATWVDMARVVLSSYNKVMPASRRVVVGGRLGAKPAVQTALFKLLAADANATASALLQRLALAGVLGDLVGSASGGTSQRPNCPRYSEGPTDSIRTFTASFKMVAETSKVPAKQWEPVYVSLLHGYTATISISYLEDVPDAVPHTVGSHVQHA